MLPIQSYPVKDARKTICLDFNGVLDTYTGYRGPNFMYPPRPGVWSFLHMLHEDGFELIVCTAANIQKVKQWLTMHD